MNYNKRTADMLGVELNEPFYVKKIPQESDTSKCKISLEKGFLKYTATYNAWLPSELLQEIIEGRCEIEREAFKPREGEEYFCCNIFLGENYMNVSPSKATWKASLQDVHRLLTGNCFRTQGDSEEYGMHLVKKSCRYLQILWHSVRNSSGRLLVS